MRSCSTIMYVYSCISIASNPSCLEVFHLCPLLCYERNPTTKSIRDTLVSLFDPSSCRIMCRRKWRQRRNVLPEMYRRGLNFLQLVLFFRMALSSTTRKVWFPHYYWQHRNTQGFTSLNPIFSKLEPSKESQSPETLIAGYCERGI